MAREFIRQDATAELELIVSWVLVPYADTYPDVHLNDYVTTGGRTIVLGMTQRCPTEPGVLVSVLTAAGLSRDRPLYLIDLDASGPLRDRLEDNAATGPFTSPVLLAWGANDEVIPPALQETYAARLCAAGATVQWETYAGYSHLRPILPGSKFLPVLIDWTDSLIDRSEPPTNACAADNPSS